MALFVWSIEAYVFNGWIILENKVLREKALWPNLTKFDEIGVNRKALEDLNFLVGLYTEIRLDK